MSETRREKDPLGPLDVPADAMYGVSMKDGATRVICQRFEGVDLVAPTAVERAPVERAEATAERGD